MATFVKGNAVANATSYELFEKSGTAYNSLATGEEINFEVSALGLAAGDHVLVVKAKADGYTDSPYSNEVTYTVEGSSGGGEEGGDTGPTVYTADPNNWVSQTISSAGAVSSADITQSNIMAANKFEEGIVIAALTSERILVAQVTYNADGSFKARSSWTTLDLATATTSVTYSDENPFNVVIATATTNISYSVSEMMDLVDVRSAE